MMMMSSLNRIGLPSKYPANWPAAGFCNHFGPYSSKVAASPPSMVITCSGFCRKWNAPCGPDEPKSTPSGNTLPCLTRLAASATFSAVMKFSVPSSSASPQRPQLRTSSAIRRKSLMLAIGQPLRSSPRHRSGEVRLTDRAAVHPEHLSGDVTGGLAVQEDKNAGLFVGSSRTAKRRPERVQEFLSVGGPKLIEDRRVGDPRRGAVDPNSFGAQGCHVGHPIEDDRFLGQPVAAPLGDRLRIALTPFNALGHCHSVQQTRRDVGVFAEARCRQR